MKNANKHKTAKLISLLLMLVQMIIMTSSVTAETAEEVPPDITLIPGDTIVVTLEEGTENILWESDHPAVATITNEGVVEAVAVGDAVITATYDGTVFHGYVHVIPREDISLNRTHTIINAGDTFQLKLEGVKGKTIWYASHPDIVSVNANGKVTAKAAGLAVVVAEQNGVQYTCLFNVRPAVTTTAEAVSVDVGGAETIHALAADKGTKITCGIDNKGIANVQIRRIDNNTAVITVTGKKPGNAIITVSNSKTKEKVKIAVTVNPDVTGSAKQPDRKPQYNANANPPVNEQPAAEKPEAAGDPVIETNPEEPARTEEQNPAPEAAHEENPVETKAEAEPREPAKSEETTKQEEPKQDHEEESAETQPESELQKPVEIQAEAEPAKPAEETAKADQNTEAEKPAANTGNAEDTAPAENFTTSYVTETVDIPYKTEDQPNDGLYKGTRTIAQNGKNGQKEVKYEVKKDSSGNIVSKTFVSEEVKRSPVNEIYFVGTFEPEVSVEVVKADPTGMTGERNSEIDQRCEEWALYMAENGVQHSPDGGIGITEDGVRYHHIIDPATLFPAESGLVSVTIVCDEKCIQPKYSGLISDGLSTACFILGKERSEKLLEMYNAEAIFIDDKGNITVTDGLKDRFVEE